MRPQKNVWVIFLLSFENCLGMPHFSLKKRKIRWIRDIFVVPVGEGLRTCLDSPVCVST